MYILVDYDNLPREMRLIGLQAIADRIQSRLLSSFPGSFAGDLRFEMRFYGGWHTRTGPSQRGAQLLADVQNLFPLNLRVSATGQRLTINAAVAEALLALPHQLLPHTYRTHSDAPANLLIRTPRELRCFQRGCPADILSSLLTLGQCPISSCSRDISEMMSRTEQKLVDTMLVTDTIHIGSIGEPKLAIVSSDDDMWPGILTAMLAGTQVFHVQTIPRSQPPLYLGSNRKNYRSLGI